MRRDFNDGLSHAVCHVQEPRNNKPSLLCSQYIVLSILSPDILYTCATRQALMQP
jgi:hypothetical protein